MIRTYNIWIDNGEEKNEDDLATPDVVVNDDAELSISAVASWAADELDIIDEHATLLVHSLYNDVWYEVDVFRRGWSVSNILMTSKAEIMGVNE